MASTHSTVFILGISSDIGRELAERYLRDGFSVFGTYRQKKHVEKKFFDKVTLFPCEVRNVKSVAKVVSLCKKAGLGWDIFISAVGTEEPIGAFFSCAYDEWEESVIINSIAPLRMLHDLYPLRSPHKINHAVFFAGGGTNNPVTNYSAYCVSKIFLIKMCELLDDENPDLNVFIVGPGVVRTKIHLETIQSGNRAGKNYQRVKEFLASKSGGTPQNDIYASINWCIQQGRAIVGGRNLSVVHDEWRQGGEKLAQTLREDPNMFKLRRHGNTAGVTQL